jgi:hypothetical protein
MNAATHTLNRSRSVVPASLAALLAGAALAAGAIAIADTDEVADSPARATSIDAPPTPGQGTLAKDEAGVAAAIAVGPEFRGSKASAVGTTPSAPASSAPAPSADDSKPAGPRGLAAGLSGQR